MSTRSSIGRKNTDGTVTAIYCHFDGYLSGVGKKLARYWQDAAKVDALIELGDLSALGEEIGERQDFDDRSSQHAEWCLAYGRDRSESGTQAREHADLDAYVAAREGYWADYQYLFDDGTWFVRNRRDGAFRLLSDALAHDEDT
jgi:hypothetical protein